jgi:hypothetical protein
VRSLGAVEVVVLVMRDLLSCRKRWAVPVTGW